MASERPTAATAIATAANRNSKGSWGTGAGVVKVQIRPVSVLPPASTMARNSYLVPRDRLDSRASNGPVLVVELGVVFCHCVSPTRLQLNEAFADT